MIMSCISSHKNAMELIKQNTSETAEPKLTDDKGLVPELLNKTESVQKFLDSFFELQYQVNFFTTVFSQWSPELKIYSTITFWSILTSGYKAYLKITDLSRVGFFLWLIV